MAPDRASLASGATGLALVGASAVPWPRLAASLFGGPADRAWGWSVFALVSVAGFCLAILALWSAVKHWLREDTLSARAKWGVTLGLAALLFVAALGPCGPGGCAS